MACSESVSTYSFASWSLENVPNLYILDDTGKIIYSKGDIKLPEMQKNRRQEEGTVVNDTFYNFMTIESNNWTILLNIHSFCHVY